MISIILSFLGFLILLGIVISFLILGTAAAVFMGVVFVLWLGTFIYFVFIHKDEKPPHDSYSINQGKEIK